MEILVKELTEVFGPSGNEENIRSKIIDEIKPYVDSIAVDKLGNLIATKSGPGEKLMLAAHMDEIGVIVTNADNNGFLRFSNVGGISPFTLIGQRVIFENGISGVFGMEKIDDIKDLKLNKMFIDIGATSREIALKKVNIGDMGVYNKVCSITKDHIIANSLDDRVGCAVLIKVLRELRVPNYNVFAVFTVQEEVGLRGAKTSAYGLEPDLAIAVDVTDTGDTPEASKMAVELGKGPAIKVKDSSVICHPKVKQALIDAAIRRNISFQLEVLEKGGTDTGAIHLARSGVPSGALSIPTRYIHTPTEMANLKDIEQSAQVLMEFIEGR
jgi:putative aminopeptidase FrvX